jgi:hypothetical protein
MLLRFDVYVRNSADKNERFLLVNAIANICSFPANWMGIRGQDVSRPDSIVDGTAIVSVALEGRTSPIRSRTLDMFILILDC